MRPLMTTETSSGTLMNVMLEHMLCLSTKLWFQDLSGGLISKKKIADDGNTSQVDGFSMIYVPWVLYISGGFPDLLNSFPPEIFTFPKTHQAWTPQNGMLYTFRQRDLTWCGEKRATEGNGRFPLKLVSRGKGSKRSVTKPSQSICRKLMCHIMFISKMMFLEGESYQN